MGYTPQETGWLGSVSEIPEAGEEMGTCSDPQDCGEGNRSAQSQRMFKGPDLTTAPPDDGVFAQQGLEGQRSHLEQNGEANFLCRKDQGM